MQISVVLPSYNSEGSLRLVLEQLQRQDFAGEFEVIVCDCSNHDLVEQICHEFAMVKYVREAERFNPGIGRNLGAKHASGQLLLFLDTDVLLQENALTNAWDYYLHGNRVFGGALELDRHKKPTAASYLEHWFFNHESQKGRPCCARNNLSSALMAIDRLLFLNSCGFRDIPRMQDTEFTERLKASGQRLTYTPRVVGYQIQDSPLSKVLTKIYINGVNLFFIRYNKMATVKKALFFLSLPLLSLFKTVRIIIRHLKYQDERGRIITIIWMPLLFLGGLYWMLGLYRSMIFGGEISARRD
ncbi:MAG: glycosyltransferase [Planctomycetales bacterium]|nr:glycosyltransferase [Planctomycetales bacterium]